MGWCFETPLLMHMIFANLLRKSNVRIYFHLDTLLSISSSWKLQKHQPFNNILISSLSTLSIPSCHCLLLNHRNHLLLFLKHPPQPRQPPFLISTIYDPPFKEPLSTKICIYTQQKLLQKTLQS